MIRRLASAYVARTYLVRSATAALIIILVSAVPGVAHVTPAKRVIGLSLTAFAPPPNAVIASDNSGAFFAAFVGALLGELLGKSILRHTSQRELAAENELRRQQLTERDETALKSIATAVEEYRVDHNGDYPKTLDALQSPYIQSGIKIIPGSYPVQTYTYEHPAADPAFGGYDIKDNGMFDPTLNHLVNALDHSLCSHQNCRYIIYTESGGLFGI